MWSASLGDESFALSPMSIGLTYSLEDILLVALLCLTCLIVQLLFPGVTFNGNCLL